MNSAVPLTISDPAWLAHRYDRPSDSYWFRHLRREQHADGPFLTDDLVGKAPSATMTRAESVVLAKADQAPIHFLFHSAFCASTLLTRALDHPDVAMGLSEPVLLNDVVGVRRRREMEAREVGHLLDDTLTMLARGWGAGEAVVVKPSCVVGPLAAGILTLRPDAKALFLYTPLDQFLSSVARKGMWCRLWVRELLEGLAIEGAVDLGFSQSDYFRLTDLQCAAVAWIAQHALFAGLVERFGEVRVRTLGSEALLADPQRALAALGKHFALSMNSATVTAMAQGSVFHRHSKDGNNFNAASRAAEREQAEAAHGEELAKVYEWALVVAQRAGVSLNLGADLLG